MIKDDKRYEDFIKFSINDLKNKGGLLSISQISNRRDKKDNTKYRSNKR